jgi:hypothetical protein
MLFDVSRDGPSTEEVGDWESLYAHLFAIASAICSPGGLDIGACSYSNLGGLELPELTVRATSEGIELSQWTLDAGPTLVTFVNEAQLRFAYFGEQEPVAPAFILVKLSETLDLAPVTPPQQPPDGGRLTTPDWFFDAIVLGMSPSLDPQHQSQVVVNLTPGQWVVVGYPFITPISLSITVGETATFTEPAEEVIDAEIVHGERGITGLDEIRTGHQIWRVSSKDKTPHEMLLYRFPEGTTIEEVMAVNRYWYGPDGTAPNDLGFNPDTDVELVDPVVTAISGGQSVIIELRNLLPGVYAVLCEVPVQGAERSHASEGEITIFTVGSMLTREPPSNRTAQSR